MNEFAVLIGSSLIMLCAVGLMALEAFIPGISITGLIGIVLIGLSTRLCWNAYGALAGIAMLCAGCAGSFFAIRAVYRSMKSGKLSRSGVFLHTESAPTVQSAAPLHRLEVGAVGTAQTALRPLGIAEFQGERIHVTASNGFVEQGVSIEVIQINGSHIVVAPVSSDIE